MLTIGQFSKICMVTVKALRHYDAVGLLHPCRVKEDTGYRYYSEEQIPAMILINKLKRCGFSLADIKDIMSSDKDVLIARLKKQRGVILGEIDSRRETVAEIDEYIASLERTGDIMSKDYKIELTNTDSINVIANRQNMSVDDFGKYYGMLYKRCWEENIVLNGICMAIYHDAEFDPENSDIELALGVKEGEKYDRTVEGTLCAVTTHYGSYSKLPEAYGAVMQWVSDNGYKIAAAPYEIYVKTQFDKIPVDEWETRIFFPVAK